ncbi:unnamed protein product [Polarella glacialis]|uniref:Uncharacterized protein n=1 Tax=Polarella glacialis TaxID=89957 RepID=A0A813CZJ2_POLGL|nr:unnamed protein product [Polarella glacialis]CAE8711688.1 unnamed protein product [Polarella glacialis]
MCESSCHDLHEVVNEEFGHFATTSHGGLYSLCVISCVSAIQDSVQWHRYNLGPFHFNLRRCFIKHFPDDGLQPCWVFIVAQCGQGHICPASLTLTSFIREVDHANEDPLGFSLGHQCLDVFLDMVTEHAETTTTTTTITPTTTRTTTTTTITSSRATTRNAGSPTQSHLRWPHRMQCG